MLTLPRCLRCGRHVGFPRGRCRSCGSAEVEWIAASGLGRVHSHTVVRRGAVPDPDPVATRADTAGGLPYVLAMVDLDEGLRVLGSVRVTDPDDVTVGTRVRAVPAGTMDAELLRFAPEHENAGPR